MPFLPKQEIKNFLEEKYNHYNHTDFIATDPIQIPHLFSQPGDIEIAAFLVSSIAWGLRKTIINNAKKLLYFMDNQPYDFVMNAGENDTGILEKFVHRTFNGEDCLYFIHSLKNIYRKHGGLKKIFEEKINQTGDIKETIIYFRNIFFEHPHLKRTQRHIPNVEKGSAAKRLNMFLRWMVRKDKNNVDFGLWDKISASKLYIPLDIHSGRVARGLGLLNRKQNDWKSVEELTENLREFDPEDPAKYDYALFGLGVFEKY